MNLSVLLSVRTGGPRLWQTCQSLAAALQPGDQLLLLDTGEARKSAALLRRFAKAPGWGHGVDFRLISVDLPEPGPDVLAELVLAETSHAYCLQLDSQDFLRGKAMKKLRRALASQQPELMLIGQGYWLTGPKSALATPDADRWPDAPLPDIEAARATARQLMPNPGRLVLHRDLLARLQHTGALPDRLPDIAARWQYCETVLQAAQSIGFFARKLRLTPLPASDAMSVPGLIADRLADSPPEDRGARLPPLLVHLQDTLALLDPAQADMFLDRLEDILNSLPRDARRAAAALPGPVGILFSTLYLPGRRHMAHGHLALAFSAADRARTRALEKEVRQLREDVDLALPGPDYLARLHDRLRRL